MPNHHDRRFTARQVRQEAAELEFLEPQPLHPNNGDEARYSNRIGNSTKGLGHDPITGEVIPADYNAMLSALASGNHADFDALATNGHLGCNDPAKRRRFVNPRSAYAYDLQGADPHQFAMRAAPAFASAEEAGEMVELYWMALARDVNFLDYGTNAITMAAAADLSSLSDFRGPKVSGNVTAQTLFRDHYPGCTTGPYISQFLLQPVNFGSQTLDMRIHGNAAGIDFVTIFPDWLNDINGCAPTATLTPAGPFFCHTGRDISQYVHVDVLFQAYFVACLNLLSGSYPGDDGNPYGKAIDHTGTGVPLPSGFTGALADVGFGTFGAPTILTLVCEVATRALKHQWYQKWSVHRRLRPEEFGGHVEVQRRLGTATYPFHPDLLASGVLARIKALPSGTHLLPLAYPEGSPVHTAYGSGHATVAGASVTVLKAFFDESAIIQNPMMPNASGTGLVPYVGPPLRVGGELNKLASNISQGRNIAGVHWRTDATEANKLGEEVAISILRDMRHLCREPFAGYSLTRFDGTTINV